MVVGAVSVGVGAASGGTYGNLAYVAGDAAGRGEGV